MRIFKHGGKLLWSKHGVWSHTIRPPFSDSKSTNISFKGTMTMNYCKPGSKESFLTRQASQVKLSNNLHHQLRPFLSEKCGTANIDKVETIRFKKKKSVTQMAQINCMGGSCEFSNTVGNYNGPNMECGAIR